MNDEIRASRRDALEGIVNEDIGSSTAHLTVNYIRISADGEESFSPNYWFMQSKQGKWGLVTID